MRSGPFKGGPAKVVIMRFTPSKKSSPSQGAPQTIGVAEPAGGEPTPKKSSLLEPANIILLIAVIMAIIFLALLRRENSDLRSRIDNLSGTLAGTPEAQPGDIIPSFRSVNLESQPVTISFDNTSKRLLFIFSPQCSECLSQFPTWNRLTEIAESKNLPVYAVSIDGLEESRERLKHANRKFEVLIMPNQTIKRSFRVLSIPEVLLVSPKGIIEWVHYGALTDEKTEELVSIIEKDPPAPSK